jgi:hypothetical protein
MGRLKRPLNEEAIQKADDEFYAKHSEFIVDGKRIPLSGSDPKQDDLRKEWIALYEKYLGEVEEEDDPAKKPEDPVVPCPLCKTVAAKIISLTFRSDHMDGAEKLLKKSGTSYDDSKENFSKPEWTLARGSGDSHPVSQSKSTRVVVDIEIEFKVEPNDCTRTLTEISGDSGQTYLNFRKSESRSVKSETISVTGLSATADLPNHVDLLEHTINWTVEVDGERLNIGSTGKHSIYVTYDRPLGKMEYDSSKNALFVETGSAQDITEHRLRFSVRAAKGRGIKDEEECVDAIFEHLNDIGVHYVLGKRWQPGAVNKTGISPKPTLHHYLWRCNANTAEGECHNIAAAFILACRILGVKDFFEVGYMYAWPSRENSHRKYPKRGDTIMGKYNTQHLRDHSAQRRILAGSFHGREKLLFVDANGGVNNFEGAAKYRSALYAIGEDKYGKFKHDDENASAFYAENDDPSSGKGAFDLVFKDVVNFRYCNRPYAAKVLGRKFRSGRKFKWED